jgi:hypothetical protein
MNLILKSSQISFEMSVKSAKINFGMSAKK